MIYPNNASVVSTTNNRNHSRLICVGPLALLTALSLTTAEAQGQTLEQFTLEQFMEEQSKEGYAAAKAIGDQRMIRMFSDHETREQAANMERGFAEFAKARASMGSYSPRGLSAFDPPTLTGVDRAMLQFANAEKLLVGPAMNIDCPDNPGIDLQMPDEFWSTVRKKKNAQGDITRFYKEVIEKYFKAKTAKEKCHWFFYAVRVSDNVSTLEQQLKSEGSDFSTSLAGLYKEAEQPDLGNYFSPTQAKAMKKYLLASSK